MAMTSLNLAGVLHRTIHIANIEDGMEESVAQLMVARAGRVERWARGIHTVDGGGGAGAQDLSTVTLVFASIDSVTTALRFNRLPFAGRTLLVWQANKDKPPELLALEYKGPTQSPEEIAEAAARVQQVRSLLEELRKQGRDKVDDAKARGDFDMSRTVMTAEQRDAFLKEHAFRQAVALTLMTRERTTALLGEIAALEEELVLQNAPPVTTDPRLLLRTLPMRIPGGIAAGAPVRAEPVLFS